MENIPVLLRAFGINFTVDALSDPLLTKYNPGYNAKIKTRIDHVVGKKVNKFEIQF